MIKYDSCIRCESKNIEKLMINAAFRMNYPPPKSTISFRRKAKSDSTYECISLQRVRSRRTIY